MEKSFCDNILRVAKEKPLHQFDRFVIQKMIGYVQEMNLTDMRKEAWHVFWNKIGKQTLAAIPTMKRWFGIGGVAIPSRTMVFQICFAISGDSETVRDYLMNGIAEPDICWNDYQEMIFVYGLDHHYEYEKCLRMIGRFERCLDRGEALQHTFSTKKLMEGYYENRDMEEEEFFLWMLDHASLFKGYSKTALSYFEMLRDEICVYVKQDAKERLDLLLKETDYTIWIENNHMKREQGKKQLDHYIKRCKRRKKERMSEELAERLQSLGRVAYCEKNTNSMLLSEIWLTESFVPMLVEDSCGLYNMTAKHLSELLRIASKREEDRWLASMIRELEELPEEKRCPKRIVEEMKQQGILCEKYDSVHTVKEQLQAIRKKSNRRYFCIQRSDLLPLILYVSQRRYLERQKSFATYDQEKARSLYIRMANSILNACQMVGLNKVYRLDAATLACFESDAMYEYQDVLEVIYGGQDQNEK